VAGAVTVESGASLAPGDLSSPIESFDIGALTFSGGAFAAQLDSGLSASIGADLLNANGDLSIASGSTLSLSDLGAATLTSGTNYTLISYAGTWDNGIFDGVADDSTVSVGANSFTVNYDDTTGGSNFGGGLYGKFVTLTVGLAGDFNVDGRVDAADYVVWRKTMPGDMAKYDEWRANFGNPPGSGSGSGLASGGSVPEPAATTLLLLGLATLVVGRRGRK
jgi:hypothetical protein